MCKPKVKINVTCPHCGVGNVREANNYHGILHKKYFKVKDVIDFDVMKQKVDDKEYPYSMLADAYYWLIPFVCTECGKGVKVTTTYNRSDDRGATHPYRIEKAGKYINYSFVKRFFEYLETKGRGIGKDVVHKKDSKGFNINIKCGKEIFVDRVWKIVKKDIINKPLLVKIKGEREIVYIGNVEFALGWGVEVIVVYAYTLLGNPRTFRLDHNDMKDFEYLEVDEDLAKQTMKLMKEF